MTAIRDFYSGRKVWVAGHRGLVGSALVRRLVREDCRVLVVPRDELDLLRQDKVEAWIQRVRPHVVFVAAGKVGGILANSLAPADFLYENLMINANILGAAHRFGVETVVALGSSCVYPRDVTQPIPESALLSGPLEPTNESYAIAKIAALKLIEAFAVQHCRRYFAVMPPNLYGPNDNFHPTASHVLPALIRRFAEAVRLDLPRVTVWGTGRAMREFMHSDDLADACVHLAAIDHGHVLINVGVGKEISIRALSERIARIAGFRGEIFFDSSRPDGTPRKLLDCSRFAPWHWQPKVSLDEGLAQLYRLWLETSDNEAEPEGARLRA